MIPLDGWLTIATYTLGCAVIVLVAGALLLRLVRRRGVTAHVLVPTGAAAVIIAGAVLLTTRQMFISEHDSSVMLVVLLLSLPASSAAAVLLGARLRGATRTLVEAADGVGDPAYIPVSADLPTVELRAIGAALDDAHRRVTDAQVREAMVEQSRRDLVAGMSHDLRTPLAGMRAMAESLEDKVITDEATVARYHRQLRVEVDRVSMMVSDLFELARVQGSLRLELERIGAGDLIAEAMASADPVARAKGVRLVSSAGADLPVVVDPTELGRALQNLLVNAIRHTPADGTIQVTAATSSTPAQFVSVSVTDSCGGIPAGDLDRVFDTAFRGEAARTRHAEQGGGLGLAIARGIVEAHHGEISVRNLDGGCRFELKLPLAVD